MEKGFRELEAPDRQEPIAQAGQPDGGDTNYDTGFPVVAGMSLAELAQIPDEVLTLGQAPPVLAAALRRIRSEIENPQEAIAGFQNRAG